MKAVPKIVGHVYRVTGMGIDINILAPNGAEAIYIALEILQHERT